MFTGIVQELGIIEVLMRQGDGLRIGIRPSFAEQVKTGDSVSVNGVCLTVSEIESGIIYFDVTSKTLESVNLGALKRKDPVNLEQALKITDRLGGHFVTGHIDAIGIIKNKRVLSQEAVFQIEIDKKFIRGIVKKGSIAVDGISLTVSDVKDASFVVNIIPHTLKVTTLALKKTGDSVNIELDIMGKYADSLSGLPQKAPAKSKITEEFLKEHGF